MAILEILTILTIHFIADFVFQDENWAVNKSVSAKALLKHTVTYSYIWLLLGGIYCLINPELQENYLWINYLIYFPSITFVSHTITDYFTSKIVKRKFNNGHYGGPIPNLGAFTIIGFDQLLHYAQLFLTYYILIK